MAYLLRPNPRRSDVASYVSFVAAFQSATRSYAKRQMQWYRKCPEVMFVPSGPEAADIVKENVEVDRQEFDRRLRDPDGKSALLKKTNEEQGSGMKLFFSETEKDVFKGKGETEEKQTRLQEADYWTSQVQGQKLS